MNAIAPVFGLSFYLAIMSSLGLEPDADVVASYSPATTEVAVTSQPAIVSEVVVSDPLALGGGD